MTAARPRGSAADLERPAWAVSGPEHASGNTPFGVATDVPPGSGRPQLPFRVDLHPSRHTIWVPAFAGMSGLWGKRSRGERSARPVVQRPPYPSPTQAASIWERLDPFDRLAPPTALTSAPCGRYGRNDEILVRPAVGRPNFRP